MPDVATIRETVTRLKADKLPVSEYTLRRWVRTGAIPSTKCGTKVLLYYPNVVRHIQEGDTRRTAGEYVSSIRRVGV